MAWIAVHAGRRVSRWFLVPITLYFVTFSPTASRHARRYLERVLGRPVTWTDRYRHLHTFASTILDRVYFLREGVQPFDVRASGYDDLLAAARSDPGAFLVGGHLGSFEVLRALGDRLGGLPVALVMYAENAKRINDALQALSPDRPIPIIALGRVESMLAVRDWLNAGGLAGMLADRGLADQAANARGAGTSSGRGEGSQPWVEASFLGRPKAFTDGPMRMAALLKRRVFFMAGVFRGGNRYDVVFKPIADFRHVVAAERDAAVKEAVLAYARELEQQTLDAPYNWFNFHDFWQEDAATPPG
jgi:predicted LPLAT superfamily acyltransferase